MKEITKVTVPGTVVTITVMKLVDGTWSASRTAQLGIARELKHVFDTEEKATEYAKLMWGWAVDARNAQIGIADSTALANFEQAIEDDEFIIEARFE